MKTESLFRLALLSASVAALSGCATQYSDGHTPMAAMAVRRAERLAIEDGWRPVRTEGEVRFVRGENIPALLALDAPAMDVVAREYAVRMLAQAEGLPVASLIARYGGALYRLAQFADGALITAAAGAATWGIAEAVNGDGGGDSTRAETDNSRSVIVNASGDANRIVIINESTQPPAE
jgi:hypothetical protein